MNQLGFIQPVDGLGEGVVIAVATATDRGLNPSFSQSFGQLPCIVACGNKVSLQCPAESTDNKKGLRNLRKSLSYLVPEVGIEPTLGFPNQILSLARLPVSPLRRSQAIISVHGGECIIENVRECVRMKCGGCKSLRLASRIDTILAHAQE